MAACTFKLGLMRCNCVTVLRGTDQLAHQCYSAGRVKSVRVHHCAGELPSRCGYDHRFPFDAFDVMTVIEALPASSFPRK